MADQTGTTARVPRQGAAPTRRPGEHDIPGMKNGWTYSPTDRTIQHRGATIGVLPRVAARVVHLTDDGQDIRTDYLLTGHRQRRGRIITEDELDRGTWAAKIGARRPTGPDQRYAYAHLIRTAANDAPEVYARAYYTDDGDLELPDPDAQTFGYRTLRGTEEDARQAWEEIGAYAVMHPPTALVLGAVMIGPALDSLDVLAHILNLVGRGQSGKSTACVVAAAMLGDIQPRRQQLMMPWNSSKQGITQGLKARTFLPLILDEHSSSGRKVRDASTEFSAIVAGAVRAMGTPDGSPRENDGFWHSVLLSSSNAPLKFPGQTEDLASRLQEVTAPFWPNLWVTADGAPADAAHPGAEHVSKRLKRTARAAGGWPLEWAVRSGMFRTDGLADLRRLHMELCARHRPGQGGIPDTIAELHMAWVVGAYALDLVLGITGLGAAAEEAAAERLAGAITAAAEANAAAGQRLWEALDALRIESRAYPEMGSLEIAMQDSLRPLKGFVQSDLGLWWVVKPVVDGAARDADLDDVSAALRELDDLGVHIRGAGANSQRDAPRFVKRLKLGERFHCFDVKRASEVVSADPALEQSSRADATLTRPLTRVLTRPPLSPLTWADASDATDATPHTSITHSGTVPAVVPGVIPPRPQTPPTVGADGAGRAGEAVAYPVGVARDRAETPAHPPSPSRATSATPPARPLADGGDQAWETLAAAASGRAARALSVAVLEADDGDDGGGRLLLPNREPIEVPLPGDAATAGALMDAYAVTTLYIHRTAVEALRWPTADDREAEFTRMRKADPDAHTGPGLGIAHPWATPGGPVTEVRPAGLSAWMALKADGRPDRFVAVPEWDSRTDGGWRAPATGAELLGALMVYLLSSAKPGRNGVSVIGYYASPNKTAIDYAGNAEAAGVVSRAIRRQEVPPVGQRPMINISWDRPPEEWSDDERGAGWLHQYDRSASWLAAFGSTPLGRGEPVHIEGRWSIDPTRQAYIRVASLPGPGPAGLPPFRQDPAEGGGFWVRTPGMTLLREVYPDWTPDVVEAWVWPDSGRVLEPMYRRLQRGREYILTAMESGRPGAAAAKSAHGALYKSFRGYLATVRPQRDHTTGEIYQTWWRPDWAEMLLDTANANTWRSLRRIAERDGRYPLSLYVDAATYASNEADPMAARPASMRMGTAGGAYTPERSVPLPELLPLMDERTGLHAALVKHERMEG